MTRNLFAVQMICALLLSVSTAAADVLTLRNGDRLSGTVVQIKDGTLTFETAHAGTVKVAVDQIAGLATDGPVTLRFRSGGYSTGRLAAAQEGSVSVSGSEGVASGTVALAEVAEMYPGTDIRRGFRWTGRVNIGAEEQSGNTDSRGLHIDVAVTGRAEKDRIRFLGSYNKEFDSGERTEDDFTIFGQHDHFLSEKYYFYTNLKFERDQPADLRLRSTIGTGLGWQVYEGDDLNLSLEAGPAYSNEDYFVGEDDDFVAGRWAVNFDYLLWRDLAMLFHYHEGIFDIQDTENVFIDSSTGMRVPLGQGFNVTLQADIDWDNQPAPGATSTDKKYLLTVGYSW